MNGHDLAGWDDGRGDVPVFWSFFSETKSEGLFDWIRGWKSTVFQETLLVEDSLGGDIAKAVPDDVSVVLLGVMSFRC